MRVASRLTCLTLLLDKNNCQAREKYEGIESERTQEQQQGTTELPITNDFKSAPEGQLQSFIASQPQASAGYGVILLICTKVHKLLLSQ